MGDGKSNRKQLLEKLLNQPIAVIGMACRIPGAKSVTELWENVLSKRQAFRRIPDAKMPLSEYLDPKGMHPDKTYAVKAACITDFQFDWQKYRIPHKTVITTDIVHWLAYEVAIQAVADAG
ncbi:MAG: hypothetical protein HQK54_14650, partial [Oligoflexales bacterium]|nr:hypothetical protein [Oligoflexales bacterium]